MHLCIYLFIYLPIYLSICLSIYLSIFLSIYLSTYLSVYLSIYVSIYLSVCLSIYLSFFLSFYLSIYLSVYLSICLSSHLSIPIYLSDYLSIKPSLYLSVYLSIYLSLSLSRYLSVCLSVCGSVCLSIYLQNQKQSNSARLPSCLNIRTSKTEQFCETASFFELDNIRNEAILRDFLIFRSARHQKRRILRDVLQKWKVECRADSLVPMRFAIFPVHLSKVLRLPGKIDARSYEVLHLSRKIILANLDIIYSKMQPLSRNQRPDLLTSLMNMSFVLRLPRKMHLCRSSSNVPCLPSFLEMPQNPHVLLTFEEVHNPLRLPRETTSEPPKVARTCGALYILTSKCASRHNGVHFFDISTSKSGPTMVCFVHFDFEMRFAPQRRALFRHLNFQKWSDHGVLCTF